MKRGENMEKFEVNDDRRVLQKNLEAEIANLKFYVEHLSKLNYHNNKSKIDSLINGH